jgi:hypothetical protein
MSHALLFPMRLYEVCSNRKRGGQEKQKKEQTAKERKQKSGLI